jgi:hypothetical protein
MRKVAHNAAITANNASIPEDRRLVTTKEAAIALRVSLRTLAYWTKPQPGKRRPRLSYVKLGKAKRFVVADILRFIDERKIPGG